MEDKRKTKIEYCNDCKRDSVFDINEHQAPKYRNGERLYRNGERLYRNGERLRECIKCGRYESEVE